MNIQGREGTGSGLHFRKITLAAEGMEILRAQSKQGAEVEDSDMVLVLWGHYLKKRQGGCGKGDRVKKGLVERLRFSG